MKVRKAVIVAAGLGTRMLPASKVIPKEMLPVVDTPAIQIVVEEAVASGIEEIVMVVAPQRTTVLEHFRPAPALERELEARGKREILQAVRRTNHLARFTQAEQAEPLGLGHAVLQARDAVGGEPFAVILPDDILDCPRPCLAQLLAASEKTGGAPVVALMRVARSEISKYGIVDAKAAGERLYELAGMVEKPSPDTAPSDLAIVGRYILTPDVFEFLAEGKRGAGGEIQLTDALMALAKRRKFYGYEFEGVRYDLGDRLGYITAQIGFGLKRPDLADRLRAYLKSVIAQS
ncbi:MAG TPA: UTP--glucose-1-phosphate uridylyltransferase [Candidatus Binataceae bacterium]|nr:UTP--glucose-1-phosphate uridylyltransferase [Candidatus Binataceae bacterium]